jgi:hypothetical protein
MKIQLSKSEKLTIALVYAHCLLIKLSAQYYIGGYFKKIKRYAKQLDWYTFKLYVYAIIYFAIKNYVKKFENKFYFFAFHLFFTIFIFYFYFLTIILK